MSRKMLVCAVALSLGFGGVACNGDEEDEPADQQDSEEPADQQDDEADDQQEDEPEEEEEEEQAMEVREVGDLGVSVELPADTEIEESLMDEDQMTIRADASVYVEQAESTRNIDQSSLDFRVGEIENTGAEDIETEELDDGWLVTYNNKPQDTRRYHVHSYRDIDGTEVNCTSNAYDEDDQNSAVEICKALK